MDLSVTQIELEYGVHAGIQLRALGPDIVPIQEEHDARLERNILLDQWNGLDRFEKAMIVAHRRIRIAIENIQSETEIKQAERRARAQRRKR